MVPTCTWFVVPWRCPVPIPLCMTAPSLSCTHVDYSHPMEMLPARPWGTGEAGNPHTGRLLKGIDGLVEPRQGCTVLPCSDLGVQGSDVEKHAALLKGQRPLVGWDPRQGVVPGEGKSQQLPIPGSSPTDAGGAWRVFSALCGLAAIVPIKAHPCGECAFTCLP